MLYLVPTWCTYTNKKIHNKLSWIIHLQKTLESGLAIRPEDNVAERAAGTGAEVVQHLRGGQVGRGGPAHPWQQEAAYGSGHHQLGSHLLQLLLHTWHSLWAAVAGQSCAPSQCWPSTKKSRFVSWPLVNPPPPPPNIAGELLCTSVQYGRNTRGANVLSFLKLQAFINLHVFLLEKRKSDTMEMQTQKLQNGN